MCAAAPFSFFTMSDAVHERSLKKRPALGRPRHQMWTVERVARLFDTRPALVAARCELGLLANARRDADGGWSIPEVSVRQALGCKMQQMFSIEDAAGFLGVTYHALFRHVAMVERLDSPLPAGKSLRALPLFLSPGCKALKRIPESELLRMMNLAPRKEAA